MIATSLKLSRADLRAGLIAVMPHAGKATKDTPHLGRVRWCLDVAEEVLILWAGDGATAGAARIPVQVSEETDATEPVQLWDTTTRVAAKILAVFRESDSHQDELDLGLVLTGRGLHLSEDDGLLPGEQLQVPRIEVPADPKQDQSVDVPRLLAPFLEMPASTFGEAVLAHGDLAAFLPAARAYGKRLAVVLIDEPFPRLVVTAGDAQQFIGLAQRLDGQGDDVRTAEQRDKRTAGRQAWWRALSPLKRPVEVQVPDAVRESVMDDVHALVAQGIAPTNIQVLPTAHSLLAQPGAVRVHTGADDPFTIPQED